MLTTNAKYIMYELRASAPLTVLEIQAGLREQQVVVNLETLEQELDRLIELKFIAHYEMFEPNEDDKLAFETSVFWDGLDSEQQEKLLLLQENKNG